MSERFNNWDANKAAHERAQYEDAVYGEAGKTDFSDTARTRVEEGDVYVDAQEARANRADDYDVMENDPRADRIDRVIAGDPILRRATQIADRIRTADAKALERDPQLITSLEDKLQDILVEYQESGAAHDAEKDEVFNRIIDRTRNAAPDEGDGPEDAPSVTEEEPQTSSTESENKDVANDKEATVPDNTDESEPEAALEEPTGEEDSTPDPSKEIVPSSSDEVDEGPELPGLTNQELRAKRKLMIGNGFTPLDVGNMSNDDISRYNLVEKNPNPSTDPVDPEEGPKPVGKEVIKYEGRPEQQSATPGTEVVLYESTNEEGERQRTRLRDVPAYLGARFSAWQAKRGERDDNERRRGRRWLIGGIGAAAATAVGVYFLTRHGHNPMQAEGHFVNPPKHTPNHLPTQLPTASEALPQLKVHPGEGFYEAFQNAGIPSGKNDENWHKILGELGPKLQGDGYSYFQPLSHGSETVNGVAGEWRISSKALGKGGNIPASVMKLLERYKANR